MEPLTRKRSPNRERLCSVCKCRYRRRLPNSLSRPLISHLNSSLMARRERRRRAGASNHRAACCGRRTGTAFAIDRVVDATAPQPDRPSDEPARPHTPRRRSAETADAAGPSSAAEQRRSRTQIQQSIARIHEACQAPALALSPICPCSTRRPTSTLRRTDCRVRRVYVPSARADLLGSNSLIALSANRHGRQGTSAGLFASRFRNSWSRAAAARASAFRRTGLDRA